MTGELVATPTWIAEVLLWAAASCAEALDYADGTRRYQLHLRGARGGPDGIMRGRVMRLRIHASATAVRAGALATAFGEWIARAAAAVNIEMNCVAAAPVSVDENVLLLWGGDRPNSSCGTASRALLSFLLSESPLLGDDDTRQRDLACFNLGPPRRSLSLC